MQLIANLLPQKCYMPFTSYSMCPTLIAHVINDILLLNRSMIVEFGSGISTLVIARLISFHDLDAKLYSVDHDMSWHQNIARILEKEGLEKNVELITAEIEPIQGPQDITGQWYNKTILNNVINDK